MPHISAHLRAAFQCQSVPPISAAHQCHIYECCLSVPINATCQCPSVPHSAYHQCHLSVPPISATY
ncbi:unnamed protein product [Staurois parvus]|uniref:Uncharacterized protein n=1 Tax=Staurois parvus TaxID=386267 RepID=A0ABN9AHH5_9NEOB|nr:unnamed protein product [Staurois parvus]